MEAMDRHRYRGRTGTIALICVAVLGVMLLVRPAEPSGAGAAPPTDTQPCSKRKAKAGFDSFVTAYNKGDTKSLDALFAMKPDFQWYSSGKPGKRVGRASHNRRTLMGYFKARHTQRDKFRVRTFDFNGNSAHWSNFGLYLDRRANDYRDGGWYKLAGKGAVTCDGAQPEFIVISLGEPAPTS